MQEPGTMGGALRFLEVHWAIGCTVYLEPASKNCAEGFAIHNDKEWYRAQLKLFSISFSMNSTKVQNPRRNS